MRVVIVLLLPSLPFSPLSSSGGEEGIEGAPSLSGTELGGFNVSRIATRLAFKRFYNRQVPSLSLS